MSSWTSVFVFILCYLTVVALAVPDFPIIYPQGSPMKYFDNELQATCISYNEYKKIPTGQGIRAMVSSNCQILPLGWTTLIQVTSYNPTGDDHYSVNAYYWANVTVVNEGCQINAGTSGCPYLTNSVCYPPGPSKSIHQDMFNITTCSPSSAAFVEIDCISTPGPLNDHCEINFTIGLCGNAFTNSSELFSSQCQS
jgi:hypothetical protein